MYDHVEVGVGCESRIRIEAKVSNSNSITTKYELASETPTENSPAQA
jgi:hypothetical protein